MTSTAAGRSRWDASGTARHAVGTRGFPWIEIDFADDGARATADVLPLLPRDRHTLEEMHPIGRHPVAAGDAPADWRPQTGHV